MRALRLYGTLVLGFWVLILLFPPWIDSGHARLAQIWYPDTLRYRLGHHWRFSPPMHWGWSFDTKTSIYVADLGARIDYRLMAYEMVLVLVSFGFLVLLGKTLYGSVRRIITFAKRKIAALRERRSRQLPWSVRR
jgi:hypothetical protein